MIAKYKTETVNRIKSGQLQPKYFYGELIKLYRITIDDNKNYWIVYCNGWYTIAINLDGSWYKPTKTFKLTQCKMSYDANQLLNEKFSIYYCRVDSLLVEECIEHGAECMKDNQLWLNERFIKPETKFDYLTSHGYIEELKGFQPTYQTKFRFFDNLYGAFMFNYAGDKLYIVLDYGTSYYRITSSRLFYDKSFIGFSLSNRHAYTSIIMYLIDNHPDMFNSLAKHIFMSGGKTKYAEEVAMNSDALFFIIKECIDRGSIL